MKKVLSLALVLCMAIACFAFAPTSAETYWDNLLKVTEDTVGTIYDAPPWGYNGEGYFCIWSYPAVGPDGWTDNTVSKSAFLTQESVALIDGENRFGDAWGIKVDLSKHKVTESAGALGNFLDVYSKSIEAGKTYTFFFQFKASSDVVCDNVVITTHSENNSTHSQEVASMDYRNYTPSTDWQVGSYTFTMKDAITADMCARICIAKAAETSGYIYIDGISLVEGSSVDFDAYYDSYKDPMDLDGDKIPNTQDPDVDNDGVANRFDRDIDGDAVKNVWDKDIDNDGVLNGEDDTPFGG